jgi:5-methylthioribose kinase
MITRVTELNIEDFDALRRYLSQHAGSCDTVSLKMLTGGISNRTIRVTWGDGRDWVLKQALAKLRVNEDWFSDPDRITVEASALRWLNRLAPPGATPVFVFEDFENHLMAMEAIPDGHQNWKSVLLSGQIVADHFEQFGSLLGTIHRRSAELGTEICRAFADTRYFQNLRLEPYYFYAADHVPEAASFLNVLAEETLARRLSLVHGDFSPKNTLIYQDRLILLDYEVVHFGDPAFDLGFALTHFLSKAHHLPAQRGQLAEAANLFWRTYFVQVASLQWSELEPRAVRHTLACLLARVGGKSPLEYLSASEASRQRDAVLELMKNPPLHVEELIAAFIGKIDHAAN